MALRKLVRIVMACSSSLVMSLALCPYAIAAETLTIQENRPVIGYAETINNIWKGEVPTKVAYPTGTYTQKLEFPIQGLLPYSTLADRATGVEVEFEVWSQAGKKIAYDTVYTFDWNPVGPNTLVSMYLSESDAIGTHTMLIRTIYELSTTGLLTRYLKSEIKFPIQILAFSKPGSIESMKGEWQGTSLKYTFTKPSTISGITKYEVGIAHLLNSSSAKNLYSNYSSYTVIKSVTDSEFTLGASEIYEYAKTRPVDLSKSSIMIRVRAVNQWGNGEWGYGIYTELSDVSRIALQEVAARAKAEAEAKAKAEAEAKAKAEAERLAKLPSTVKVISGIVKSNGVEYQIEVSDNTKNVNYFEAGIRYIADPNLSRTSLSNYSPPVYWDKLSTTNLFVATDSIRAFLQSRIPDISNTSVLFVFRAVNESGMSEWSNGFRVDGEQPFPLEAQARQNAAKNQKVTITCIKGKLTKKVTAVNPKCPKGYKKK